MSRKTTLIIVLTTAVILTAAWFSPFWSQSRIQSYRDAEYKKLVLPTGVVFESQGKYGDALLAKPKKWGIQYLYTYDGDQKKMIESFKKMLSDASYDIWVEDSYWVINGYSSEKNIHIRASIHPSGKQAYPINVTVEGMYE